MANKKKNVLEREDTFTHPLEEAQDELILTGNLSKESAKDVITHFASSEFISDENKAHLKFTLEWLHYLSKGSRSVEFRRQAKAAAASLSKLL